MRLVVSDRLVAFAESLNLAEVPVEVQEKTKIHVLDALGVASVAARSDFGDLLRRWLRHRPAGDALSIVGMRAGTEEASAANASLIHALDFDDTHEESLTHPGAPVVGAVLGAAASVPVQGPEILAAIILGFEVITTLGAMACRNSTSQFPEHGFHPTAVVGAPAVALAVGRVLGLSPDQLQSALSIAASLAGGSSQSMHRGLPTKVLNVGRSASTGVFAAEFARAGFSAGKALMEENRGFFSMFGGSDSMTPDPIYDLGSRWRTLEVALKEYPAGIHEHSYIRSALALRRTSDFKAEEIAEVVYGELGSDIGNSSEPVEEKRRPRTGREARFSRYYCIATALARGAVDVEDFTDDAVKDEVVLGLCSKTHHEVATGRWVQVRTIDSRIMSESTAASVASLDVDGVLQKFAQNCARANKNPLTVRRALDDLWNVEDVNDHLLAAFDG